MRDAGLKPDIPLGPFEGALIAAYTTKSRSSKLHARRECSSIRAEAHVQLVPLNADVITRMCGECAVWGRWARPGTALDLFLRVFWGYGLSSELDRYTTSDPDDDLTDEDIANAAGALQRHTAEEPEEGDDTGDWRAKYDARDLRDSRVIPEWCRAVDSLLDAAMPVARYPWLKPWAGKRLGQKAKRVEELRQHAVSLLDADCVKAAAAVQRMARPELPVDDAAFAVLGTSAEARRALENFWSKWQRVASSGRLDAGEYDWPVHELADTMGRKRKGRDELSKRARQMLSDWASTAITEASSPANQAERLLAVTIPARQEPGEQPRPLDRHLDAWDLGVLSLHTVAADWATRTFLLKVPQIVAARLLSDRWTFVCVECDGDPADTSAYEGILEALAEKQAEHSGHSAFLPGVLDDTPVSERRPVALAEVRALRGVLDANRQLFVVCSGDGIEVLPLIRIEERCEKGNWSGILLAEAEGLPSGLVQPQLDAACAVRSDDPSTWESRQEARYKEPRDPQFGQYLGMEAGLEELQRHTGFYADPGRELERSLRVLALLRGVHDLRQVDDDGYDLRTCVVPREVWRGLLVEEHLDLRPFMPEEESSSRAKGLGLPLGALAGAQVYTTNADPGAYGKGHSLFCQHARDDRGITSGYFLLTLQDLVARRDLDWCSKCAGYSLRRLTEDQTAYYRCAHRLVRIGRELHAELQGNGRSAVDLDAVNTDIDEIFQWVRGHDEYMTYAEHERVDNVVTDMAHNVSLIQRYRQDGWPNSGNVLPFGRK